MKLICACLLLLVCSGCADPERNTMTKGFVNYVHDPRTELCFATRYGGAASGSYVMVTVACSPAVLAIAYVEK